MYIVYDWFKNPSALHTEHINVGNFAPVFLNYKKRNINCLHLVPSWQNDIAKCCIVKGTQEMRVKSH